MATRFNPAEHEAGSGREPSRRLLVLTPAELTRDPRARRAALAAKARGYDVVGVCAQVEGDTPQELPDIPVICVGGDRVSAALRRRGLGGMRRSRPPLRELRGLFRLGRLAGTTVRLVRATRPLRRFDVVHANDFDSLPAAWVVARRDRARLVYDSHELYTSQEPDPPRLHRAVVARLEAALARRAHAVVTTGDLYARELERRLRLDRPAVVVLNCPERMEREPSRPPMDRPLRVVYQAAMGAGRRIQDLVEAAEHAPGIELTLRVLGADYAKLETEIERRGVADRVRLEHPVPADRLVDELGGFDAGVIINRPVTLTDELVVPNKLFEYMMAGLAVVAPRLPGIAPVLDEHGVGVAFEPGRPEALGEALVRLAGDRECVREMGRRARRLALERYNAEAQADALARVWAG
jgi:glycogen(starch) synthase